jgi:hypothetical protein
VLDEDLTEESKYPAASSWARKHAPTTAPVASSIAPTSVQRSPVPN